MVAQLVLDFQISGLWLTSKNFGMREGLRKIADPQGKGADGGMNYSFIPLQWLTTLV